MACKIIQVSQVQDVAAKLKDLGIRYKIDSISENVDVVVAAAAAAAAANSASDTKTGHVTLVDSKQAKARYDAIHPDRIVAFLVTPGMSNQFRVIVNNCEFNMNVLRFWCEQELKGLESSLMI